MELGLKGKKALVTGGSKGIGLAIKQALEKEGVEVTSWSRSEGVNLMRQLKENKPKMPKVDILINNVGGLGTGGYNKSDKIMHMNYGLTNIITKWFLEYKPKFGRVVTISSMYGKEKGHNPWFTAAKAAQIAYMKSMAGRIKGVTFNTICPGHIDVGKQFPDNPKIIGKPEDVANIVIFLCSDLAKHINGATITVDGGESHSF